MSKTASAEMATQLPSFKCQREVQQQQQNKTEPMDLARDSNSVDSKKSFKKQLSTSGSEQLTEEKPSPASILLLDPQAPQWSVSGGDVVPIATLPPWTVLDPPTQKSITVTQMPEDEDGLSLAGSWNLTSDSAAAAGAREEEAATTNHESYSTERNDSTEDRLVLGGQREDQKDDGAGGDDVDAQSNTFAAEHNALDQMSIGQSSLGQTIVDLDATEQLHQQFAANVLENNNSNNNSVSSKLEHDSIASSKAEDSISSDGSTMRQQTDALLQLTANYNSQVNSHPEASSQENFSESNGGNNSLADDDKQQNEEEILPAQSSEEVAQQSNTTVQGEEQPKESHDDEKQKVAEKKTVLGEEPQEEIQDKETNLD
jgi:hypothetical protein